MTQPLAGNILYGSFATYFFSLAGQSDALRSAAIVQATGFAANVAIFFLIENPRLGGRWKILFGGLTLETLGMLVIGIVGSIWFDLAVSTTAGNHLIAATVIGNIGSVTGPGAAGWAYTAESGSARLRAKTTTLGNLGNCMMMNASGVYAPYLLSTVGREDCDAQIDELFVRRIPARKFQSTECTGDYGRDLLAEHAGV
ncbi:hypothetical protein LTR10_020610 [Elasticomyces elasticus]|uniref:Major facilitator superfamily (MFS) profile domain-containing protein n=1 Tax=Exophiala sideris TaxID=1016849 RepID=A0ABR0JQ58_9EURO|nr:hypothetical protein LTR10_020610 [Elasticomyces elasticus]KAK5038361.1 hypothetical protein LTS07_001831 [Exophiala sideris]KAK5044345.1 hypothetical protein LTR13_000701 [Exophiala sideris]KAK5067845.1 hypothetical protein LTR69_001834 [Exophiala sideris]KAK5183913.1 hypothetical protein LTR44_003418 [Eurotiomycetes sp. CCFEE 6388]